MMLRQSLLEYLRPLRKAAAFAFVLPTLALGLAAPAGAQVVISQIYGGGGNTGATFTHDYVELHNRGTTSQSLTGWTVQYASATGSSWNASTTLSGSIGPGK
jgi:predicted extracellular nuclease